MQENQLNAWIFATHSLLSLTDEEKIHMLGLPNVTNTIQKVQGSPIVFTTIEKDEKIFHQSSIHIYFSDNDMSLLYWLTYLYIVCILWQRLEHDTGIIYSGSKWMTITNVHFTTISGHFPANCMFIFHITDVQTVILRCLTGLNLDWFKSYDKNEKHVKNAKTPKIAKNSTWILFF